MFIYETFSAMRIFVFLSIYILFILPRFFCTDPIDICKKCTWVGWQAWETCRYEGAKRRVRLMCCPDDIPQPVTLEGCYTRCYNESNGKVKLDELYDFKACNDTTHTFNSHYKSIKSSSNLFRNNLPLLAGLISGSLILLASNILLLGCLCKKKKRKERRAFPARRPVHWT